MDLEGTYQNGVIVLDAPGGLHDGDRVRVVPTAVDLPKTFGERYAKFCGAIEGPDDLAAQHDHYRLGVPKR